MKQKKLSFLLTAIVLLLVVVLSTCDLLTGAEEEGNSGPTNSVEDVNDATLENTASAADFATGQFTGETLVSDKESALLLAFRSVDLIGTTVENYIELTNWEPTGTSSITTTPTDLFDETNDDLPTYAEIVATLTNEAIGDLVDDIQAAVAVEATRISYNSDDLPTRIVVTATGDAGANLYEMSDYEGNSLAGGSFHAAMNGNLDTSIRYTTETDESGGGTYPNSITAAIALSFRASAALSSKGNVSGDNFSTDVRYGNLLVTASYDENVTLNITEAMLEDETGEALPDYLEQSLDTDAFSLEIQVYDDSAALQQTYTYTVSDIETVMADL